MSYLYKINSAEDYNSAYKKSVHEPEAFWRNIEENFKWHKNWDKVLEWILTKPKKNWFAGG